MATLSRHEHLQPQPTPSTQCSNYLMLDLFGTVVELRRMSSMEARDINLELEALEIPYHWVTLASMTAAGTR